MKIKSEYLQKLIDVECYDGTDERNRPVKIITHASLEHILFNTLPNLLKENGIQMQYDLIPITASKDFASFLCKIKDTSGRNVIDTGESDRTYLVSTIAEKNLIKIARNRALDSALIKYLRFPKVNGVSGRIFSSSEDLDGISYTSHETNKIYTSDAIKWDQFILSFGKYKGQSLEAVFHDPYGQAWLLEAAKRLIEGRMNSKNAEQQQSSILAFLKEKGVYHGEL